MNLSKSIISIGIVFQFTSNFCYAQLGVSAPMPQIQPQKKASGPSLEETVQWITQKLDTLPTKSSTFSTGTKYETRNQFRFIDCNTVFFISEARTKDLDDTFAPGIDVTVDLFRMEDVDPDQVHVVQFPTSTHWTLNVSSFGKKNVFLSDRRSLALPRGAPINSLGDLNGINDKAATNRQIEKIVKLSQNEGKGLRLPLMQLEFQQFEDGDKIASALKHAGLLCRQKAAQERAAQPAKPKELF